MKNPMLETAILKILNRVETGLKEKTLQAETEIAMDRPQLTTDEFADAVRALEDAGLIVRDHTLLKQTMWGITPLGRAALRGA